MKEQKTMAEFNAKQQLPGLLDWMRAQMKACGGKTAVIGISGGKDSSVTAALSVAAYGRENVVGVLMPDGVQPDIDYSNGLVDVLNIRHYTFNIHGGTSGILDEMARVGIDASRQTKVNLPSRIRYDGDEIFEFIRHDKKTGPDGAITVVKVPRLGECRLDKVPLEDLKAIIGGGVR